MQKSLDGLAPMPLKDRLFLALMPDEAARLRIAAVSDEAIKRHGLTGPVRKLINAHVTLHHLGDYPELQDGTVRRAMRAMDSFDGVDLQVRLDRISSFRGRGKHPCVLLAADPDGALAGLWRALELPLRREQLGAHLERRFTPHLTVLYDDKPVPEQPIEPIVWQAREVVLIHSLLGQSTYRLLGKWPLK